MAVIHHNMLNYLKILVLTCISAISTFAACHKEDPSQAPPTLYERLGGIHRISEFVDQFIVNVKEDQAINARFIATLSNPSSARLFRLNLIDQICAESGGPCTYKGMTMKTAHKNMNITKAEFDALVGDFVSALDQLNVGEKEKTEILGILRPMQADIVSR